ncbi:LAFA_0D08834g1_1 [Lachancea sp. 'fantastica']|nr:LAFA_0D08834g1_1 [Lachancea sp. 'fantastica']
MSTTQFPTLFDMSALEQQPRVAVSMSQDGQHSHEPVVGELIFDKFAQSRPRPESFSESSVTIKSELQTPLLGDAPLISAGISDDADELDNFFASSADSTPLFGLENVESDPQTWQSLFDDDIAVSIADPVSNPVSNPEDASVEAFQQPSTAIDQNSFLPTPVIEEARIPGDAKKKPSTGMVQKPSSLTQLGFVPYTRKNRSTPLTPVIPESDDPVVVKRARNTEAARRSRARKMQRMSQLEDKVEELLKKNSALEQEVASLRSLLDNQC